MVLTGMASASAAELAVLKTGFTVRHESREVVGAVTRLHLPGNAGFVDVPTDQIETFAADDAPPLAPEVAAEPDIPSLVREAGTRHGIDPEFVASVVRAESGFNVKAVSPKGARGLMQLMPDTATRLGVSDSFDPAANIEGGTRFLRELLERYDGDAIKALAAYNAGPGRVETYRGVPPFRETRAYIARIIQDYNRKKLAQQTTTKATEPKPHKAGGQQ